jgi:hypothetical protein
MISLEQIPFQIRPKSAFAEVTHNSHKRIDM